MKNKSIWKENVSNKELDSLNKNIDTDILIIGGGIAGLMTAYFLSESDKKVTLIDKSKCAEGASSKNTGKLTFMQELVYYKIKDNYDDKVAKLYLDSQREAISLVQKIVKKNNIICDLEKTDAYVFSNKEEDKNKFDKEMEFYKENDIKCSSINELEIDFPIKMGIKTEGSYRFNPYKFLVGIKNVIKDKIAIYENSMCVAVKRRGDSYIAKLENGVEIRSKYVVVSSQYPFFIYPFFTPFKTTVEKSFIVSGEHKLLNFQAISEGKPTFSFNFYNGKKNYLVFSRRSHSVTNHLDTREDEKEIVLEYQKYFGEKPEYYFQNHDLMTYDYMPFVGKIDNNEMYVLTGFNKWGNTNGVIGGKVISDLILKHDSKYKDIFNPKRSFSLLKIKNLAIYNSLVTSRYILNKISSDQEYYNSNVKIKYIDGKKCGIYTDDKGKEHIVSNICPHMKCNLIFNYVDKTWDCPCHASRFDIDGNIINGPSVYDIKIKDDNLTNS